MPNEFFRRKPGDGKTYIFEGEEYSPRIAIQRIHFSEEHPTQISLPIYTKEYTGVEDILAEASGPQMLVFPNPASDVVSVYVNTTEDYELKVLSLDGALIGTKETFSDNINVNISGLSQGLYFIELTNLTTNERMVQKLTKM
jgi:hypothetical protein